MTGSTDDFDITELAAEASVSVRTVRYYIQQGLLPAAERGTGTRYGRDYLHRLQLTRRLQREHLPLAEIRRRLEGLSDAEVAALVSTEPEPSPESAADYIRSVLSEGVASFAQAAPLRKPSLEASVEPQRSRAPAQGGGSRKEKLSGGSERARGTNTAAVRADERLHAREQHEAEPPVRQQAAARAQYDRITLAPDVELHVRRPLTREANRQVERLLDAARQIFEEESP